MSSCKPSQRLSFESKIINLIILQRKPRGRVQNVPLLLSRLGCESRFELWQLIYHCCSLFSATVTKANVQQLLKGVSRLILTTYMTTILSHPLTLWRLHGRQRREWYELDYVHATWWLRHRFPKWNLTNPSEVFLSSDVRPHQLLSSTGFLILLYSPFELPSLCVAWHWNGGPRRLSCRSQDELSLSFANWTILAPEEILISICRNSWIITFRFNDNSMTDVSVILRPCCVPPLYKVR